jgi:hypothetical protein
LTRTFTPVVSVSVKITTPWEFFAVVLEDYDFVARFKMPSVLSFGRGSAIRFQALLQDNHARE